MRVKQWAWVLAALPLSACFSGDADTVKQFVPDETPQYTLDQLLTHRKNCSTASSYCLLRPLAARAQNIRPGCY
jgi:hypothetical protein